MTRKDFEALAARIAVLPTYAERRMVYDCIVPVLCSSNPRFNASRFREACRVVEEDDDTRLA